MANSNRNTRHDLGEGKASSLTDRTAIPTPRPSSDEADRAGKDFRLTLRRPKKRGWVSILVDVILILILAGLVVGGYYGYRAVKEIYAPTWDTREVTFCVKMEDIDPDMVTYGADGQPTFTNHPIWSSDKTDADCLGTVTHVRPVLVTWDDGRNTMTLYLTVEATAYYREGKGYRMGETMLLAGTEGTYRVRGMVAEGIMISMHEIEEESDSEAGTDWVEPSQNLPAVE